MRLSLGLKGLADTGATATVNTGNSIITLLWGIKIWRWKLPLGHLQTGQTVHHLINYELFWWYLYIFLVFLLLSQPKTDNKLLSPERETEAPQILLPKFTEEQKQGILGFTINWYPHSPTFLFLIYKYSGILKVWRKFYIHNHPWIWLHKLF